MKSYIALLLLIVALALAACGPIAAARPKVAIPSPTSIPPNSVPVQLDPRCKVSNERVTNPWTLIYSVRSLDENKKEVLNCSYSRSEGALIDGIKNVHCPTWDLENMRTLTSVTAIAPKGESFTCNYSPSAYPPPPATITPRP